MSRHNQFINKLFELPPEPAAIDVSQPNSCDPRTQSKVANTTLCFKYQQRFGSIFAGKDLLPKGALGIFTSRERLTAAYSPSQPAARRR